jgi:hypothetical protein
MQPVIQYGGRAAGAYFALKLLAGRVGGGALGAVAVIALGWLAGGLVADAVAKQVGA